MTVLGMRLLRSGVSSTWGRTTVVRARLPPAAMSVRPPPTSRRHARRHARRRRLRGRGRSRTTSTAARSRRSSTAARPAARCGKLAVTHAAGKRWILVGLGRARRVRRRARARRRRRRAEPRARARARDAVLGGARTTSTTRIAAALVEGTLLAAYRFDRYKTGATTTSAPARAR